MSLTLTQFLLLVITIAVVVAVTFLAILALQLIKTTKDGQKTLAEIRQLTQNLQETSLKVNSRIESFDKIVEATKNTAANLSEIAWFTTTRMIRPTSKYWPFLFPLIRLGWRHFKKRKEPPVSVSFHKTKGESHETEYSKKPDNDVYFLDVFIALRGVGVYM